MAHQTNPDASPFARPASPQLVVPRTAAQELPPAPSRQTTVPAYRGPLDGFRTAGPPTAQPTAPKQAAYNTKLKHGQPDRDSASMPPLRNNNGANRQAGPSGSMPAQSTGPAATRPDSKQHPLGSHRNGGPLAPSGGSGPLDVLGGKPAGRGGPLSEGDHGGAGYRGGSGHLRHTSSISMPTIKSHGGDKGLDELVTLWEGKVSLSDTLKRSFGLKNKEGMHELEARGLMMQVKAAHPHPYAVDTYGKLTKTADLHLQHLKLAPPDIQTAAAHYIADGLIDKTCPLWKLAVTIGKLTIGYNTLIETLHSKVLDFSIRNAAIDAARAAAARERELFSGHPDGSKAARGTYQETKSAAAMTDKAKKSKDAEDAVRVAAALKGAAAGTRTSTSGAAGGGPGAGDADDMDADDPLSTAGGYWSSGMQEVAQVPYYLSQDQYDDQQRLNQREAKYLEQIKQNAYIVRADFTDASRQNKQCIYLLPIVEQPRTQSDSQQHLSPAAQKGFLCLSTCRELIQAQAAWDGSNQAPKPIRRRSSTDMAAVAAAGDAAEPERQAVKRRVTFSKSIPIPGQPPSPSQAFAKRTAGVGSPTGSKRPRLGLATPAHEAMPAGQGVIGTSRPVGRAAGGGVAGRAGQPGASQMQGAEQEEGQMQEEVPPSGPTSLPERVAIVTIHKMAVDCLAVKAGLDWSQPLKDIMNHQRSRVARPGGAGLGGKVLEAGAGMSVKLTGASPSNYTPTPTQASPSPWTWKGLSPLAPLPPTSSVREVTVDELANLLVVADGGRDPYTSLLALAPRQSGGTGEEDGSTAEDEAMPDAAGADAAAGDAQAGGTQAAQGNEPMDVDGSSNSEAADAKAREAAAGAQQQEAGEGTSDEGSGSGFAAPPSAQGVASSGPLGQDGSEEELGQAHAELAGAHETARAEADIPEQEASIEAGGSGAPGVVQGAELPASGSGGGAEGGMPPPAVPGSEVVSDSLSEYLNMLPRLVDSPADQDKLSRLTDTLECIRNKNLKDLRVLYLHFSEQEPPQAGVLRSRGLTVTCCSADAWTHQPADFDLVVVPDGRDALRPIMETPVYSPTQPPIFLPLRLFMLSPCILIRAENLVSRASFLSTCSKPGTETDITLNRFLDSAKVQLNWKLGMAVLMDAKLWLQGDLQQLARLMLLLKVGQAVMPTYSWQVLMRPAHMDQVIQGGSDEVVSVLVEAVEAGVLKPLGWEWMSQTSDPNQSLVRDAFKVASTGTIRFTIVAVPDSAPGSPPHDVASRVDQYGCLLHGTINQVLVMLQALLQV